MGGLFRLADAGHLDLNTRIVDIIDPWHANQSLPPLRELFADVANISKVTVKQLLGMQSGIDDYNNSYMYDWTLSHPAKDYMPINYITDVGKKPFLFKPGEGSAYTSNGYVLAGMVLAALRNASSWDGLDQLAAIGLVDGVELSHTIFMKRGRCSNYNGVTHQYAIRGRAWPAEAEALQNLKANRRVNNQCAAESGQMRHVHFEGPSLGSFSAENYEACCEKASKTQGSVFVFRDGNCTVLLAPQRAYLAIGSTSGFTVQHFNASDILDMYDYSCLNGWTMGNIAIAPVDAVKFWHALLVSRTSVKPESLKQMMTFNKFSQGWGGGIHYGYGIMQTPTGQYFRTKGHCSPPLCVCKFLQCRVNLTQIGHMGADWGSSMPTNGWIPQLRASVAMSLTSMFMGMNTSLTLHQNGMVTYALECYMYQLLLQHQHDGFPDLVCPPLPASRAEPFIMV